MTTPNRNRNLLLSAAACGLFFASANAASAQEQQTSQKQAKRAPVAATRSAPQQGGLIGALPGQTGQAQQIGAVAPEAPPPPEAAVLPAPPMQQGVTNPEAAVEMDMPLGDMPLEEAEAALDRPAQAQVGRAPQRGQIGQTGQRGRVQGEQPIELPGLEAQAINGGEELLPPGDEAATGTEILAPQASQHDQAQAQAKPEKKPGFFRRMWTSIKNGTKKGVGVVSSWFHRKPKANQAAPADAQLTDINLGGGGDGGGSGSSE
jgi:hypothetical protein